MVNIIKNLKSIMFKNRKSAIISCISMFVALMIFVTIMSSIIHRSQSVTSNNVVYKAQTIVNSTGKAYIEVDGKVEAYDTKKVYVNKKLRVKEIFVKENDYINKGDLLMTFDENDRNTIKRNIQKEKLNLQKLERNLEVERQLYSIGGSSKNAVLELEEEVATSKIVLEEYEEDLAKTLEQITSPVDGTIVSLTAEENYAVNTEQPLLEITDLSQLKIVLEVPEYDTISVKVGQKIDIRPEVYEKKLSFEGKVVEISKVSQTSSSTSENVLEVEVTPNEQIPNLAPGFKVSGTIYLDPDPEGINIPKTAVLEDNGSYFVYKLDEKTKKITKTTITIGDAKKGDTVHVESGLSLGDTILITPSVTLNDGDTVEYTVVSDNIERREKKSNNDGGGFGPPM